MKNKICVKLKKLSTGAVIVSVCIILLVPFAFACICVASNGNGLTNMYLQNLLVYLLPMCLYLEYSNCTNKTIRYSLKHILIIFAILFILELALVVVWVLKFKNDQVIKSFVCQFLISFIIPIYMLVKSRKEEDREFVGKSFLKFFKCSKGLLDSSVKGVEPFALCGTQCYLIPWNNYSISNPT